MTERQLSELTGVPRFAGRLLYLGGAPMQPEQISFGDRTYREIYLKRVEDIAEKKVPPNAEEEELLKNYVIYRVHAPIFRGEFTQELRDLDFSKISLDDLILKCLDFGLDPL